MKEKKNGFGESAEDVVHRQCEELNEWRDKYRTLAAKYEEQIEGTSLLVKDCDAWREKYQELHRRHEKLKVEADNDKYDLDRSVPASQLLELQGKYDALVEDNGRLCDKNVTLESSNSHMEAELNRVRDENVDLNKRIAKLSREVKDMRSRGWLARLLNR